MASAVPLQEDLQRFHYRHYAPSCTTYFSQTFGVHAGFQSNAQQEEEYGDDDDGLGYYSDGTKRTLTDEQIAMFRHSELQALLRERRKQKLQQEETSDVIEPLAISSAPDRSNIEEDEDEEEYARFLAEERKNLSKSAKKKRKKNKKGKSARASTDGEKCPRRIAREMDDSTGGADAALDYDEAPQPSYADKEQENALYHKPVAGRRTVEYGDVEENSRDISREPQASKAEKAFQWPKLGTV
ncbi:hypothetical protein L228DRAFT_264548 [Xylona heveae TC161]|uniref:Uncharacterized protein n=1 Tax=Xylona heveae (strain CBS 132557 / TC161) TaxID=1328760 RepID=A0A165JE71_XYLHT|nr:hypothetical protein L228DRAFT_264548 [Xylona heveae TC161]KZF26122.1 hypothetical protein L228DRAFT_264548 [Xylona heveae TC161]